MKPKILVIDDEEGIRFGLSKYLSKAGYYICEASLFSEAKETIHSERFDAILLDLYLPDGNGLDLIPEIRENSPETAIVVITGYGDIPLAVEAMRRGADNFLTKPVNMSDLEIFLKKSLELGSLRREHFASRRLSKEPKHFFGESEAMKEVIKLASIATKNDSNVLILGETGAGKGMLAKWIHSSGLRRTSPFVEVNCSNLRGELLASELFGHIRGAFTSAIQDKKGLIELADGGTLFLDEISDMDITVQAQFLKVIEEKSYRRLGEVKLRKSDFRLICATNRDILEEVRVEKFRKDLYFRINVLTIMIPPLRERPEDIPGLVRHILNDMGAPDIEISDEIIRLMQTYSWPGNIRELRNVLESALLLSDGKRLSLDHFSCINLTYKRPEHLLKSDKLHNIEESHIRTVIKCFNGDTRRAAEALGISRATLYRKLKKFQRGTQNNL